MSARACQRTQRSVRHFSRFGKCLTLFLLCAAPVAYAETFTTDTGCSISTSLVGYWKLDETSGTRADSKGTNTLTDNATVTSAAGKRGNAGQFTAANSEYLSIADNAALSLGADSDVALAAWVYLDSKPAGRTAFVSKWNNGASAGVEYLLEYESTSDRIDFTVGNGSTYCLAAANSLGSPATGTWYFVVAWHDSTANSCNIQINNGTVDSTTGYTGGTQDTAFAFEIGRIGGATSYMDGRIDEVALWKRVLTAQDRTDLYHNGLGATYHATNTCSTPGEKEFVSTIKASGGDYTSLGTWNSSNACDLTERNIRVFPHGGITGTMADGASVTGATSGATGTAVHVTPTQILIKNIAGNFQNEQVRVDVNNYVTVSGAGMSPIAVAETSIQENIQLSLTSSWVTSATNYVEIRAASAAKHAGVVGGSGAGIKDATASGTSLTSATAYLRLTNLHLESTHASVAGLLTLASGTTELRMVGCLLHNTSTSATLVTVNAGAVKLANNFTINHKSAGAAINIANTASGTNYIYGNSLYSDAAIDAVSVAANVATNIRNNVVFGFDATPFPNTGGGTLTGEYNAFDTAYVGGTGSVNSLTVSDHLTSTSAHTENLHLKTTSSLKDKGWLAMLTDATFPVLKDIDGQERTTYEIGADVLYTPAVEFISAIRITGATNPAPDYTTFTLWEAAVQSDLTATTTKVFSHGGKVGTIADAAAVRTSISDKTATAVHVTPTQVLLTGISGSMQAGDKLCAGTASAAACAAAATNYVILRDAGNPAIAVAEAYNDWSANGLVDNVTIAGWTANPYRYPLLRPAPGHGHSGRLVSHDGFYLKPTATNLAAITVSSDYAHIEGLDIDGSNITAATNNAATATSYWKGNLIKGGGGQLLNLATSGKQHFVWNNFFIEAAGSQIIESDSTVYLYNNSILTSATNWQALRSVGSGTMLIKNTAVLGANATLYNAGIAGSDSNASGDGGVSGTNGLINVTTASTFTNATSGSEDLHLKSGSALIGVGADLSNDPYLPVTDDVDGIPRATPYDIGADRLDNVWKSASSTDWNTAANWSIGVPTAGQSVLFNKTSVVNCVIPTSQNLPTLGALTLGHGYTGTVTVNKNAGPTGATMTFPVTKDIRVLSGNLVFQGDTALDAPNGRGYAISAANITVAKGASLHANGQGFAGQAGPGAGSLPGGASGATGGGYGGQGGLSELGSGGGATYGSATSPTALGSGGGHWINGGGAGAGALKLTVSSSLAINGTLSANGSAAGDTRDGGGSGGSLWLASGTLTGSGTIAANGGIGGNGSSSGGGGGGGRIDLASVTYNFTGQVQALGGSGWRREGYTGTLTFPAGYFTTFTPAQNLTLGHGQTLGTVTVNDGITLTLDPTSAAEQTFAFTSLTVSSGGKVSVLGNPSEINAASGGTSSIRHGLGPIITATTINIATGGVLSADGAGTLGRDQGPGKGLLRSGSAGAGGGGYGGTGADGEAGSVSGGLPYGSATAPTALGSGGGSWIASGGTGGNAVKLVASGTLTVNGTLSVNGVTGGDNRNGGGSGGSLWLNAATLAGGGSITANGGNGIVQGGGGGGGRMRIEYGTKTFNGTLTAAGGSGYASGATGQADEYDTDTVAAAPAAPTLSFPADTATFNNTTPYFQFSTTDANLDFIKFKIEIATANTFGATIVQTIDQTASQTGWRDQTEQTKTAYASGKTATFIVQTPLTAATMYYWRVSAIDPTPGTNGFGSVSATRSFTTGTGNANYWTNTTGDGLWTTAGNWSLGTVPAATENAIFNSFFSNASTTVDVNSQLVADSLGTADLGSILLENAYTGTLTLKRADTGAAGLLKLTRDLTINTGTVIVQGNTGAAAPNGAGVNIDAASITVASGATLHANGLGFGAQAGPGVGANGNLSIYGGGGGYGGKGGVGWLFDGTLGAGGATYGSATGPTALGSGAGGGGGGAGAGAIKLTASGTVTVNGTLSANGTTGCCGVGGGSGGSLWISSGTLAGSGTISANGATGNPGDGLGGGGGGGRIDLSGVTYSFTGQVQALGGGGWQRNGFTGTIQFPSGHFTTWTPTQNFTLGHGQTFGDVTINSGITLTLDPNTDATKTFTFTSLTINSGGSVVVLGNQYEVNSASGGTTSAPHGIGALINATTLTLNTGGSLLADSQGWRNLDYSPYSGMGPGAGAAGSGGAFGGGGGHGGAGGGGSGGGAAGTAYGLATAPTALGSSGGDVASGRGGGAIKLNVTGTATVSGTMSANGANAACGEGGGGSGGSLWLVSGTFAGNGTMRTNGGTGCTSGGGGGAGGRVKISYTTKTYIGTHTATAGSGGTGATAAANGTVILSAIPGAPSLSAPADAAANQLLKPALVLSATDADSDYVQFKIEIATANTFGGTIVQTIDQTASQTGWTGQNAGNGTAYASAVTATFTVQTALTRSTTYYWRAYAKDPAGAGEWSAASSIRSFTANPTVTLTAPNTGTFSAGQSTNITWTFLGPVANLKLSYSLDNGTDGYAYRIVDSAPAETDPPTGTGSGQYAWTLPDVLLSTLKVKIEDVLDATTNATSSGSITVAQPTLTLTAPNGTEQWFPWENRNITWTSVGTIPNNLTLEYSKNNFGASTQLDLASTLGLRGFWRLDEGSGTTAADGSSSGNTGTLTGGPTWATGKSGNAVSFDGVNDYVDLGDPANGSLDAFTALTVAGWFKFTNTSGSAGLVSKGDVAPNQPGAAYYLIRSGGYVQFGLSDDVTDGNINRKTPSTLVAGQWYHIAGVWDGGTNNSNIKIYLDGAQVDDSSAVEATGFVALRNSTVNLTVGRGPIGTANQYHNGLIDELRIYNRALSATEVAALHLGAILNTGTYTWMLPWDISDTVKVKISTPFRRFFKDATDVHFNLGTLSSTAVSGTGSASVVQLATTSTSLWAPVSLSSGSSPTRSAHAAGFDGTTKKLYVFAGNTGSAASSNLWAYDAAARTWTQLSPTGGPPAARTNVAGEFDEAARKLYIFGGNDGADNNFNDLWAYDVAGNTWTQASPASGLPAVREQTIAAFDQAAKKLYVFGGLKRPSTRLNDLWVYDVAANTWTSLGPTGGPPAVRLGHSAAFDQAAKKLYVFGGHDGSVYRDDLWVYDVAGNTWTQLSPTGPPSARQHHSTVFDQAAKKLYVFGGYTGGFVNDLWVYDVAGNTWTQASPAGSLPAPRYVHSAVLDEATKTMRVFGGNATSGILGDVWELRVAPYAASGTFTSKIFDTTANTGFGTITWSGTGTVPLGTNWQTFSGQFTNPRGIFVDTTANKVYVAGGSTNWIAKFDSGSGGTTLGANWQTFGTVGSGVNQFNYPVGIFVETATNKVYVGDILNSRLVKFDSGSGGTTLGANWQTFGTVGSGVGQFALYAPVGVFVETATNKVYVTDETNARLAKFDSGSGGTTLGANWQTFGTLGSGVDQFGAIGDVSVDTTANKVYATDYNNARLAKFDSGSGGTTLGANWQTFGTSGSGVGQFTGPNRVFVETTTNKVYVSDVNANSRIAKFDSGSGGTTLGANWQTFGSAGTGPNQFNDPIKTFVEAATNKVYVVDGSNQRIVKFDSGGAGIFTIKARSSTSATMVGAPAFSTCTALTSGADLTGGCVTDAQRYVQYEATLTTAAGDATPKLDEITLNYDSTTTISDTSDADFAIKQPKLTFTTQPSGTATGNVAFAQQPVVAVQTTGGTTLTNDNATSVTLAATGGTGTLLGTLTQPVVNGVATFSGLKYGVAETITLTATSSPASVAGVSNAIAVSSSVAAPTLISPADLAANQLLKPTFQLSATDAQSDYLQCKIEIATANTFGGTIVQTIDQTASQTGWTGQNAGNGTSYASGATATFTVQTALTRGTTYYWRAYAKDPAGYAVWSAASATRSFTANPTVTLTAPDSGTFSAGQSTNITWTFLGPVANVKLSYSLDNGTDTYPYRIVDSAAAETDPPSGTGSGQYAWTVPDVLVSTLKVKIEDVLDATTNDVSSGSVTIAQPSVTLTAPNGAEQWYPRENRNITWTSVGTIPNIVRLQYSKDNFTNSKDIDAAVTDTTMAGFWRFGEGSGSTATDDSDSAANGTVSGATWIDGKLGSALSFDGVDDEVSMGAPAALNVGTSNFSISMWIKTTSSVAGYRSLAGKKDGSANSAGWQLYLEGGTSVVHFTLGNGAASDDINANVSGFVGAWHHVVGVRNGTTLLLYVDGAEAVQETLAIYDDNLDNANNFKIGFLGGWGPYHGLIDEVRLYKRALTAAEITAQYNSGNGIGFDGVNDGTYAWPVPFDISDTVKVKISVPFRRFFKDATDTHFNLGTLSSTAVSGSGSAAVVQLASTSTPGWQQLSPTGSLPSARESMSAVFDQSPRKVYVFGGYNGSVNLQDLWAYDVAANSWSQLSPTGPPGVRSNYATVFDPAARKMYVFGGNGASLSNDLWVYDAAGNTWTQASPTGSLPAGRYAHTAVLDPAARKMYVFGGNGGSDLNDLWVYDVATNGWTLLSPSGSAPPVRRAHVAVFDETARKMYVFGGINSGNLQDLWAYDVAANSWTQLSPTGGPPAARRFPATVFDTAARKMYVFGGQGTSALNDLWVYDAAGNTWTQASPTGSLPAGRNVAATVFDQTAKKMFVFGGGNGSTQLNDLWALYPAPHVASGTFTSKIFDTTASTGFGTITWSGTGITSLGANWQAFGTGPLSGSGQFNSPYGVFVETSTNKVYVTDFENHRIVKFDSGGGGTTLGQNWVAFGSGPGTATGQFSRPYEIYVDTTANKVYVTNYTTSIINRFDSGGGGTTLGANWQTFGSQGPGDSQFQGAPSIFVDTAANKIYVGDFGNHRIAKFDSGGGGTTFGLNWQVFGTGPLPGTGQFNNPKGIFVDTGANKVYVADNGNHRIVKFDSGGGGTTLGQNWVAFGSQGSGVGQFNEPPSIFVDTAANKAYVAARGSASQPIVKFDSGGGGTTLGQNWQTFGSIGSGVSQFSTDAFSIFVDTAANKAYVADQSNHRIVKFDSGGAGAFTVKARSSNSATMVGAPAFSTCTALTTGQDLTGGCVTDAQRYVQYEASLSTAAGDVTPKLDELTLNYDSTTSISDTSNADFSIVRPKLTFTTQPSATAVAGVAFAQQPVVAIQNLAGSTITTDNATQITLAMSGGTGTLSGTLTKTVVNGVATFTGLSYNKNENITLIATSSPTATSVTSRPIAIGGAPNATIEVTGVTDPLQAGVASNVIVTIRDAFGNVANDYTGTIHFTSSDAQAVLPADFTFGTTNITPSWLQTSDVDFNTGTLSSAQISGTGTTADVALSLIPAAGTLGANWQTFGSSGSGADQFTYPYSVFVDSATNKVYVADNYNHRITKFDSGSGGTTLGANWQTFGSGPGSGANQFTNPSGVFVETAANKVYVLDGNNRLVKFDMVKFTTPASGTWETFGSVGSGASQFTNSLRVFVESATNKVYVADQANHRLAKFDSGGGGTTLGGNWQTFGANGSGANQFIYPMTPVVDTAANKVYVADLSNARIAKFDSGSGGTTLGANWETFGASGSGTGQFSAPHGVFVDTANNKVYVAENIGNRLAKFDSGSGGTTLGANWQTFGSGGTGPNQFSEPNAVFVDTTNNKVYMTSAHRLAKFDSGDGSVAFTDSFATTTSRDATPTTANWDEGRGEIRLAGNYAADAAMAAAWMMEEASGTRADATGHSNTLADINTVAGSADNKEAEKSALFASATSEALIVTATNLDSTTSALRITGADQALSISAWVKPSSTGNQGLISLSKPTNRHWLLQLDASNKVVLNLSQDGTTENKATGNTALATGTWYHVAAVYNDTDMRIYVNGVLDSSADNPKAYTAGIWAWASDTNKPNFALGHTGETAAGFLNGQLDEVAVWSRALSAAEALSVYQKGLAAVSGYLNTKTAQSLAVDTISGNVVTAKLTATETLPTGTAIAYFLSANGGTNWEAVTNKVVHTFANAGSDLRWKADLTNAGSAASTPVISDIAIDYATGYVTWGTFESVTKDTIANTDFGNLTWTETLPAGTDIQLQIATNNDNATWTYKGPDGTTGTFYTASNTAIHAGHNTQRYLRVKATLTGNGTQTPKLSDVTIPFDSTAGAQGSHTFTNGVTLKTVGEQWVKVTDVVTSSFNGQQSAITITHAAANKLGFTTQPPTTATAGVGFGTVTVAVQDTFGNTVTSDSTTQITVARGTSGTAALQGTLTQTVVNGVATFASLSYNKAETMNITATSSPVYTAATSSSVAVAAALTTKLALTAVPASNTMTAGTRGAYTVTVQDQYDNAQGAHGGVTINLSSTSASASKKFYDAATLGNIITSLTLANNTATGNFWYYDETSAAYTITAGANDPALKGAWRFEEGSGTSASDSSGNSNTGTLTNGPTWTTGKIGQALSFDGVDDKVAFSSRTWGVANSWTVSYWKKSNNITSFQRVWATTAGILTQENGEGSGSLRVVAYDQGGGTYKDYRAAGVMTTSWQHVAVTWNGTALLVYLNGSPLTMVKVVDGAVVQADVPRALDFPDTGVLNEAFNGLMDAVRFYNRALSAAEIAAQYNSGNGTTDLLSLTSATHALTVASAAATRFAVTGTTPVVTGAASTITITSYDAFNNVAAATYTGDKSITMSGAATSPAPASAAPTCTDKTSAAVAFGTATTMTFTSGVATCSMKLYKAEISAVKATQASILTAAADDLDVTVRHGAADHIKFSGNIPVPQPANKFEAGIAFPLSALHAVDLYDNVADGANGATAYAGTKTITYSMSGTANAPDGSPTDAYTSTVAFTAGAATTTLSTTLYRAQATAITARDSTLSGTDLASNSISVVAGLVAKLTFNTQPSTTGMTAVALAQQPIVAVADQYGNPVTAASDQVTLASSTTTGSFTATSNGALSGDALTVTTSNGLATFAGVKYSYPEAIYLRATSAQGAPAAYSFQTALSSAATGTMAAGALVEPSTISSLVDTQAEQVQVFDFKLTDLGVDGLATKVKQVVIKRNTATDTTGGWAGYVGGAQISDGTTTVQGTITDTALTFGSGTTTIYTVGDNANKTLTLSLFLRAALPAGADGKMLGLTVDPNDEITADAVGSTMAAAAGLSTSLTVSVTATKFLLTGTDTILQANVATVATIKAMDANNNIDSGFVGAQSLVFSGASQAGTGEKATATDFSAVAIDFGQATLVNFAAGINSSTVAVKFYKAEVVAVKVSTSDATINTSAADDLDMTITGGAAAKLAWNTQPKSVVVASAPWNSFSVNVTDAYNNLASSTASVTLAPSAGCSVASGSTNPVAAVSGTVTFANFAVTCAAYPTAITVTGSSSGLTSTPASAGVTVSEKFSITVRALDSVSGSALTDVTFKVLDKATGLLTTGLSANPMVGNSPFTFSAPYKDYNFNFAKDAYVESTVERQPNVPADGNDGVFDNTITYSIFLTSVAESLADYRVLGDFIYDEPTDKLTIAVRLDKRGRQVLSDVTNTLKTGTINIYSDPGSTTAIHSGTLATPDANGYYLYTITTAVGSGKFVSGRNYFAKMTSLYGSADLAQNVTHAASTTFEISITARLKTLTDEILADVATTRSSVAAEAASTRASVTASQTTLAAKIAAEGDETQLKVAEVKTDAGKILTAAEKTIPDAVEKARKEVETTRKSEILTRENTLVSGDSLMIRYRTFTGLAPTVDVYDAKNALKVTKAALKEVGTTGIYEKLVKFEATWGKGDFTVVCAESTNGTLDAIVISVITTDLEEISGTVSAVLGNTADISQVKSGMTDLRSLTSEVNSQFSVLESALSKISGDMAGKLEAVAGAANELSSVHGQLSKMADLIKEMTGQTGVTLEKLFEVSAEKKEDITYLKNKTQQLRAAMEINSKMLDNVANKPVTQTWFEFR